MLFKENVAVHCTELRKYTLWAKCRDLLMVKQVVRVRKHYALKG